MQGSHYGQRRTGAGAYAAASNRSRALSASPVGVITMLFDGLESKLREAKLHFESGNIAGRGAALAKAIDIVNLGLLEGLDMTKGGEIAANLKEIYTIVARELFEANAESNPEKLDRAIGQIAIIASAWREMERNNGH